MVRVDRIAVEIKVSVNDGLAHTDADAVSVLIEHRLAVLGVLVDRLVEQTICDGIGGVIGVAKVATGGSEGIAHVLTLERSHASEVFATVLSVPPIPVVGTAQAVLSGPRRPGLSGVGELLRGDERLQTKVRAGLIDEGQVLGPKGLHERGRLLGVVHLRLGSGRGSRVIGARVGSGSRAGVGDKAAAVVITDVVAGVAGSDDAGTVTVVATGGHDGATIVVAAIGGGGVASVAGIGLLGIRRGDDGAVVLGSVLVDGNRQGVAVSGDDVSILTANDAAAKTLLVKSACFLVGQRLRKGRAVVAGAGTVTVAVVVVRAGLRRSGSSRRGCRGLCGVLGLFGGGLSGLAVVLAGICIVVGGAAARHNDGGDNSGRGDRLLDVDVH